jgi:alkanesulfonate monooxygenase SsuD/methylene tetrahydromethanopterin reductase-like flavin-dependent oxidoreductase (luciferase family)
VKIGIFDHLDRRDVPLQQYYADRLALVEHYDRLGFHAYHVAEHHQTPLGLSPSPSVYLSAVAQRTSRLRFGPLVYILPLYHPLRLADEICMLDHLSGGRLELGVGRGISPIEVGYFGVDVAQSQAIYLESFEVLMKALRSGAQPSGPVFPVPRRAAEAASAAASASADLVWRRQPGGRGLVRHGANASPTAAGALARSPTGTACAGPRRPSRPRPCP